MPFKFFKDFRDNLLAINQFEALVCKSTNRKLKLPKQKHIKRLLLITFSSKSSYSKLVMGFKTRLVRNDWAVTLKSLLVLHVLYRFGDPEFIKYLAGDVQFLLIKYFSDNRSERSTLFSKVAVHYAKYLKEKIEAVQMANGIVYENRAQAERISNQPVDDILVHLDRLLKLVQTIMAIPFYIDQLCNPIILEVMTYIVSDLFTYFSLSTELCIIILRAFQNIRVGKVQEMCVVVYEQYCHVCKEVVAWLEKVDRFKEKVSVTVPIITVPPEHVAGQMRTYITSTRTGRKEQVVCPTLNQDLSTNLVNLRFGDTNDLNIFTGTEIEDSEEESVLDLEVSHGLADNNNSPVYRRPSSAINMNWNAPPDPFQSSDGPGFSRHSARQAPLLDMATVLEDPQEQFFPAQTSAHSLPSHCEQMAGKPNLLSFSSTQQNFDWTKQPPTTKNKKPQKDDGFSFM